MAYYVTAAFDESGTPKTGLSPTVTIHNLTDGTEDVSDAAMTEVGDGGYKYNFTSWDKTKQYYYVCDSVTLTGKERYSYGVIERMELGTEMEGTLTLQAVLRILLSYVAGKASGGGSTPIKFRDQADGKDRINMTVDSNGNRTSVTVDGS